jgi:sigma54-dependent transcription regulator
MRQVFNLIMQAAPSRSTILVTGESGTGKELVARAIHANSPRADRAFVTVNSGNLPPDLLESTLFGHVKGAFTGAINPKKGLYDLADKGSIFFDEIGNIPHETQAKLLRVMQEREFMRLGGMETIRVDARIIAATNCDLKEMVDEGPLPRGPLLPAARDQHLPAAAAGAEGRHPAARAALPREVRRGEQQGRHRAEARGARPADGIQLAGQRARARERHRARRGAEPDGDHRCRHDS